MPYAIGKDCSKLKWEFSWNNACSEEWFERMPNWLEFINFYLQRK